MAVKTYKAKIRINSSSTQDVTIQADSSYNAKIMLEKQYGKGSVYGTIVPA
jgi:hypothetical protein